MAYHFCKTIAKNSGCLALVGETLVHRTSVAGALPSDPEVIIVGAGAAGLSAAKRIQAAGRSCLVLEASERLGGRAWTRTDLAYPQDMGCGWLHSADRNPWVEVFEGLGLEIDRTPAPWERRRRQPHVSKAEQSDQDAASKAFYARLEEAAKASVDRPASDLLEPGNRWNAMFDAVSTFANGVELEGLSAIDFDRYDDSGTNWRVPVGYGTAIARFGQDVSVRLNCPVSAIDLDGRQIQVTTPQGTLRASAVVVTVSTNVLASGAIRFQPNLPDVIDAAAGLPLGIANKLVLSIEGTDELMAEASVLGRTDRTATAAYHFKPFGRPWIEAYYGGDLARSLEKGGLAAFGDHASGELVGLYGAEFGKRLTPVVASAWAGNPRVQGSYSHAKPGFASYRERLARPIDDRLFFAGEACSLHDFSTAHGARQSGLIAAEHVLQALDKITAPPQA